MARLLAMLDDFNRYPRRALVNEYMQRAREFMMPTRNLVRTIHRRGHGISCFAMQ